MMADKYGRRITLMLNIITYSVFELAFGLRAHAQDFSDHSARYSELAWAANGAWVPLLHSKLCRSEGRGFFSGLLQEGYVIGYLMAAVVYGNPVSDFSAGVACL